MMKISFAKIVFQYPGLGMFLSAILLMGCSKQGKTVQQPAAVMPPHLEKVASQSGTAMTIRYKNGGAEVELALVPDDLDLDLQFTGKAKKDDVISGLNPEMRFP